MAGPLAGLKVLDLSRVLAGPWASQTLADLGAEVIKIEKPGTGDDTRSWGPPYARDSEGKETTESAYFLSTNRGKKSVTVDITSQAGQKIVRQLSKRADILIENHKVGGLARYGLDYEILAADNPRLIYCSITGFGQTGPYSHLPGYDFMIQGLGGLMSITGAPDNAAGGGPMKTGVAVADLFSGLYATVGILAAVQGREKTGRGEHIDISLLDVQVAMLANQAMNFLTTGQSPQRLGNAHPNIVPYEAFETTDGHMILAVGNDDQFKKFCALAGLAGLSNDSRFATNPARVTHRRELIPLIAAAMRNKPTPAWIADLGRAGVPCGPINAISDVFADPHVRARGIAVDLEHPTAGKVPSIACPIRFESVDGMAASAPPTLGQHTEDVLSSVLDLSKPEIQTLRAARAI